LRCTKEFVVYFPKQVPVLVGKQLIPIDDADSLNTCFCTDGNLFADHMAATTAGISVIRR